MKFKLFLIFLFPLICTAQDNYHQSILNSLQLTYGLDGGVFIFPDTEDEVFNNIYQYGNMTVSDEPSTDQSFTQHKKIQISAAGNNAWDAGIGMPTSMSISQDDLILFTFWAKQNSDSAELFAFAEESTTYEKEYYFPISFTPEWTQYYIVFKASSNFNVGRLQIGFHLASQIQEVEIAGMNAINYENNYSISDLPTSFSPYDYEGRDLDAPWRALAQNRIETIRKADLAIQVIDHLGNPVENANIEVDMVKHHFGFGSALVTCRFPGNNCYDETYVNKVLDLDGEGHGFNECVSENALKWRGWEQEWLGTPEETVGAFKWLTENGIKMRGHTLFWPGSDYLPEDINNNLNDINYLRNRIDDRIDEMISHPELSNYVRDWDVFNEITTNRTLESAFNDDPSLENGRKLYNEVFAKVRDLDPDLELYINDYMAISSGSANLVALYKSFLDELKEDEVPFDGIGFQCHIGSVPNGIPQVEQVFNDFYQRYGKRMKVTEYDIDGQVDELTQADYMRDLLTLTFSHPGMDAFIMWGFWDGNHWKDNAAMFNEDWTIKPSGEAFIQKVFQDWWTDVTASSDNLGLTTVRAFKGTHTVKVNKDGASASVEVELTSDTDITIQLPQSSSVGDLEDVGFLLMPNPIIDNAFSIEFSDHHENVNLKILDMNGRLISSHIDVKSKQLIPINVFSGAYQVRVEMGQNFFHKIIVVK